MERGLRIQCELDPVDVKLEVAFLDFEALGDVLPLAAWDLQGNILTSQAL